MKSLSLVVSSRLFIPLLVGLVSISGLCWALFTLPKQQVAAQANGKPSQPKLSHSAPTTQSVYAPIIELPGFSGAELVLNNRSPHNMDVTSTFYTLTGTSIAGKTLTLTPAEVRYVALTDLIPVRHISSLGAMSLEYVGGMMEVAAQLTLLGRGNGGSLDVSFSAPMDYRSRTQQAVWWMPDSAEATIVLSNASDANISAKLHFADGQSQTVYLSPYATELIDYPSRRKRRSVTGGSAESVKVEMTGSVGSLRMTGCVRSRNKKFTSSIRFYDPENARQPHLFATNLRVKRHVPHLVLKNTTNTAIAAKPKFLPLDGTGTPLELAQVALEPGQSAEVDLRALVAAAVERVDLDSVSVQVVNDGPTGSLIGALCTTNQMTEISHDVPLRDSGPVRNSTGSYPWRVDGDYTTIVSITNVGAEPAFFTATISYRGGKYLPLPRELAVGETAVFDLNRIRNEQISDQNGRVLPSTAEIGQFHWSVLRGGGSVRLIGRGEMVSRSRMVSSSYSCPVCCPDSFADLIANPNSGLISKGGFMSIYVDGIWLDCYRNLRGPYAYPYGVDWWCQDASVVAFTAVGGSQYNCNGIGVGTSLTDATAKDLVYYDDGMDCYTDYVNFHSPGDVKVYDFTVTTAPGEIDGLRPSGIPGIAVGESQAIVTVQTNPAVASQRVTLSAEAEANSGGHIAHSGVRPLGTFVVASGVTDGSGRFTTIYTAPIFGGTMRLNAKMGTVAKQASIRVYVRGLQELGAGTNYVLVGATATHPSNHYGTALAITRLPQIADAYAAKYPGADRLRFNDMSLINGGKFEIPGNWSAGASHHEHREGRNCDVGSSNVPRERWKDLIQIFTDNNSPNFNDETASANHWHLRFE